MRKIFALIPTLFLCSCFLLPKMEIVIPDEPSNISSQNIFQDVLILIELFSTRNEQRIYDEGFSDSLKSEISLTEFKTEMDELIIKYGELEGYPFSHLRSIKNTDEENIDEEGRLKNPIIVKGLFEYERKTVYFSLSLKGKSDDLKIYNYRFIED